MKNVYALFFAAIVGLTCVACEEKGPAEKAGEKFDEITKDVGNSVEDACEDVKDAAGAEDKDC